MQDDQGLLRMYYGAWQYETGGSQINYPHPYYLCYAQSSDGKSWRKPSLGMVEFEGDRKTNIVLAPHSLAGIDLGAGDTAIFRDANPAGEENAPYKALVPARRPRVFGAPVLWGHPPPVPPGRTLSAALELGEPCLYTEAAGAGRARPQESTVSPAAYATSCVFRTCWSRSRQRHRRPCTCWATPTWMR